MNDIHTFGSPPFGDKEFTELFKQEMDDRGINVYRINGAGDNTPDTLSDEAPWYQRPPGDGLYEHVSDETVIENIQEHSVEAYQEGLKNPVIATPEAAPVSPKAAITEPAIPSI